MARRLRSVVETDAHPTLSKVVLSSLAIQSTACRRQLGDQRYFIPHAEWNSNYGSVVGEACTSKGIEVAAAVTTLE